MCFFCHPWARKQASQEAVELFLPLFLFFCEFQSLSPLAWRGEEGFPFLSFSPSSPKRHRRDPKEEEAIIELRYDPRREAIMRSSRGWISLPPSSTMRSLSAAHNKHDDPKFFLPLWPGATSAHIFSSLPIQNFFFFFLSAMFASSVTVFLCMGKKGGG